MELKQILALSAVAVSFAAFAAGETSTTVQSSNEFGLLKITTSSHRIILGVPWCACSATTDQDISVKDFVSTIGLDKGDTLNQYTDGHNYRSWIVDENGEWVGAPNISTDKAANTDPTERLPRGNGLMLLRYSNTPSAAIYLHGQVANGDAEGGMTEAGSPDNPAYTFVSYPGDKAWNPNVNVNWGGGDTDFPGDQLIGLNSSGSQWVLQWVGSQDEYSSIKGKMGGASDFATAGGAGWYCVVTTQTEKKLGNKIVKVSSNELKKYDGVVEAGTGFWYVSKNGIREFSWK